MIDIIKRTAYRQLDKIGRPDIFLKLECDQFSNSFKSRGIASFLSHVNNPIGLITFTTGNHGVAVSAIAKKLSLPAIIITNDRITSHKKALIESNGATIKIIDYYDIERATSYTTKVGLELGYTFVPLYNNDSLLNGYSDIAKEICADIEGNLTIFFPVGSGSLLYANSKMVKALNPSNRVIGVEPKLYQRFKGEVLTNQPSSSIADSLAIDKIPEFNLDLENFTDSILAIEENEIAEATRMIYEQFNLITEPGGAITLAGALKTQQNKMAKIAVITGKNISQEKFDFITTRF